MTHISVPSPSGLLYTPALIPQSPRHQHLESVSQLVVPIELPRDNQRNDYHTRGRFFGRWPCFFFIQLISKEELPVLFSCFLSSLSCSSLTFTRRPRLCRLSPVLFVHTLILFLSPFTIGTGEFVKYVLCMDG